MKKKTKCPQCFAKEVRRYEEKPIADPTHPKDRSYDVTPYELFCENCGWGKKGKTYKNLLGNMFSIKTR